MNFKKTVAIVAAAGAMAALAVPAMAETSIYGSARLTTFWNTVDSKAAGINNGTTADFEEALHANSRLGVNFSNGTQGAKIEVGVGPAGLSTRHVYGTQKFDFGTVLVGQTENPYYFFSASVAKADNVNNNYGALWDTRQAQIKLTMDNGLYVAAIAPSTVAATTENYLPKLNVGYEGKAGSFSYGAGLVGQTYKQTVAAAAAVAPSPGKLGSAAVAAADDTVTSLLGYFHGKLAAGPAAVQFNLGVGQNMGDMGFTNANTAATNKYTGGKDTTTIEGYVQGTYTLSPTLKLNAGFGYVTDDNDNFVKADNRMQVFVNAPVVLAKGFSVTPEFSYFDQLDQADGTKGDKEYLVGAKWQFDF